MRCDDAQGGAMFAVYVCGKTAAGRDAVLVTSAVECAKHINKYQKMRTGH